MISTYFLFEGGGKDSFQIFMMFVFFVKFLLQQNGRLDILETQVVCKWKLCFFLTSMVGRRVRNQHSEVVKRDG